MNWLSYLEGENNNGDLTFTTTLASDTFNDRVLPVTSDALFYVVGFKPKGGMATLLLCESGNMSSGTAAE